jgi:hypothetical protein
LLEAALPYVGEACKPTAYDEKAKQLYQQIEISLALATLAPSLAEGRLR